MTDLDDDDFVPLFNGENLDGWFATPRTYGEMWPGGPTLQELRPGFPADYNERAAAHAAKWTVEDGAIVGRQDEPGSGWGGYLVSERKFGNFELLIEAKPDWPADTGIMVRKRPDSFHGLQVLVDHRQSGSIGGFYGNGLGSFLGVPFALDAEYDASGTPVGLREDDPKTSLQPIDDAKRGLLTYVSDVDDFLATWRFGDWNEFRIRVVGAKPTATVWINGLKIAAINLATISAPNYDADAVASFLGPSGHIGLEVHDNDVAMGEKRWGPGAACRWRNIRVKELAHE
ncbi:3-keto-disaccharide hydrolase [Microbacterium sp. GXF0217]